MLQQTISNILNCRDTIERYQFDEAATKQYVILPILRALDWEDSNLNTLEVFPEKAVGRRRVDYALQQDDNAFVFIECKRWGEDIERIQDQEQICLYACMEGVDIAVITNGKKWNFYLPGQTTSPDRINVPWQDRMFCPIDLELCQEAISDFQKYLTKSNVVQGMAKTEAEEAFQPQQVNTPLPRQRYCLPILKALEEYGGSARTEAVLERVHQLMADELRPVDESRLSNGQLIWKNRAHNMRRALVDRGLMNEDTQRGTWEISEEGREYLTTNQGDLIQSGDIPLPRQRYCLPILRALESFGGTAQASEVLRKVDQLMEDELRPIDRSQQPNGQLYWVNRAHNMRQALVDQGLMNEDSQPGTWEISEEGREYLRANDSGYRSE